MDGYLHVAKKVLRLSERYEGEMECKKEKKKRKNALGSQIFLGNPREERTVQY